MAQKKNKTKEIPLEIPSKYTLIAADLSLKRPGFCMIHIEEKDGSPTISDFHLSSVDNKNKIKPRGQLLEEIATAFSLLLNAAKDQIFLVREQSINNCGGKMAHSSTAARTGVSSVVGVMDLVAWQHAHLNWEEYYPLSIKKLLTGSGKAEKQTVAAALSAYLGERDYKNDDESDAAAAAVAWLVNHNQMKQIIQEDTSSE